MAKKKPPPQYATCGTCYQDIVLEEVREAIRTGKGYVHPCGRVLVKGKTA